jgi:hypothetical protein
MARKGWERLTDAYRRRLERGGVTRTQYEQGVSLSKARGHAQTPEHPQQIDLTKHQKYVNTRKQLMAELQRRMHTIFPAFNDYLNDTEHVRYVHPNITFLRRMLKKNDNELESLAKSKVDPPPDEVRILFYH